MTTSKTSPCPVVSPQKAATPPLHTRGCGFHMDGPCEPIVAYRTQGAPRGLRIVLNPVERAKPPEGKPQRRDE